MKIKGKCSSVWDVDAKGRGYVITTDCEIDLETGAIEAEPASDDESMSVETLDRMFVEVDGREFQVNFDEDRDRLENLQEFSNFVAQSMHTNSPA
jgi:hypothetical protein